VRPPAIFKPVRRHKKRTRQLQNSFVTDAAIVLTKKVNGQATRTRAEKNATVPNTGPVSPTFAGENKPEQCDLQELSNKAHIYVRYRTIKCYSWGVVFPHPSAAPRLGDGLL
jgi:hypothetical protein